MDAWLVQGGATLKGIVTIAGAKNAALPLMAAAVAFDAPITLHNVPPLRDVIVMGHLLASLGIECQQVGSTWHFTRKGPLVFDLSPELVGSMRGSVCLLGPLVGRWRHAVLPQPGGCPLGSRPIDIHLRGFEALGAKIIRHDQVVVIHADKLKGASIDLRGPHGSTVTGTCNLMIAACFARGTTHLYSAAREPEVVELGRLLQSAGANIEGLGTSHLTIHGGAELTSVEHALIPDRIEAATWLTAAILTRGSLRLKPVIPHHLQSVIQLLRNSGNIVEEYHEASYVGLEVAGIAPMSRLHIQAGPYPAIPTDTQPALTVLATVADGVSLIEDKVFPERFSHAAELRRLGASIEVYPGFCRVCGTSSLKGAVVRATDLRAAAGLSLAGLVAKGTTTVLQASLIDRGYVQFEEKMRSLGAHIMRCLILEDESEAISLENGSRCIHQPHLLTERPGSFRTCYGSNISPSLTNHPTQHQHDH